MRRAAIALALAFSLPTAAQAQEMFLQGGLNELKPQYRQCLSRYDCTFIKGPCGSDIPVNTASKGAAEGAVPGEKPTNCSPDAKAAAHPTVDCINGLCRITSAP